MKLDERLKIIYSRRSIRKFTDQTVSANDIQQLLQAGMAAPSANNKKPWYFIVITERTILDELARRHPYAKMLFQAPLAIAVCADPKLTSSTYWSLDCSAATENILIAATALGLGAVWLGIHPREERKETARKILKIPSEYQILSLIAIGHPGEEKLPRTQFDPARVFHNLWGNKPET